MICVITAGDMSFFMHIVYFKNRDRTKTGECS